MIGTVYFIQEGTSGPVKIGWTQNSVEQRRVAMQTGNSDDLIVIATIPNAPKSAELRWHKRFQGSLRRSEWFFPTPDLLAAIAREALKGIAYEAPTPADVALSPAALAHKERIAALVRDVKAAAALLGWAETTASRRIFNDGKELARLEAGGGTMPATLDRAEARLSDLRDFRRADFAYAVSVA